MKKQKTKNSKLGTTEFSNFLIKKLKSMPPPEPMWEAKIVKGKIPPLLGVQDTFDRIEKAFPKSHPLFRKSNSSPKRKKNSC